MRQSRNAAPVQTSKHCVISFDWAPMIGGAHLWLYEVYRRWAERVVVVTRGISSKPIVEGATDDDKKSGEGICIVRCAEPPENFQVLSWASWRSLLRVVSQAKKCSDKIDACYHTLRVFPEGLVGLIAKKSSFRRSFLVTYAHGEDVLIAKTSRFFTWAARRVYEASDLVIANSENSKRLVLEMCSAANVVVVHPGVDAEAFVVDPHRAAAHRAHWNWPSSCTVICTVARMEPRKNQRGVIDAVRILVGRGLDIRYVCAGSGPELSALRDYAETLGLGDRVIFPGRIDDSEKLLVYASSDIHVMPSIDVGAVTEGFGIVFLEAAAAGIPSVAGRVGGQSEAVLDGKTGLVIDGRDPVLVADAIQKLVNDPSLRNSMAENARAWARQNDWRRLSSKIRQEVQRVMQ